jgi:hypothetical protein
MHSPGRDRDQFLVSITNTNPLFQPQSQVSNQSFSMNLTDLKQKPISELLEIANEMGLEGVARSRKQDVIFGILKAHAKNGESIFGDGVLEILQDGFGFLRTWPDPTTSTCRPARSGASPCAPATCCPARSARRKTASAILRC